MTPRSRGRPRPGRSSTSSARAVSGTARCHLESWYRARAHGASCACPASQMTPSCASRAMAVDAHPSHAPRLMAGRPRAPANATTRPRLAACVATSAASACIRHGRTAQPPNMGSAASR
eukprot:7425505-Lingulodinium_polyedra.AAC.1